MNELRIRLEGALETVEAAVAELERFSARLHSGDTTGLGRALRERALLEPARAKVARFASEDPQLAELLARLEAVAAAIDAQVHAQADARGFAAGSIEVRAKLLEAERVFFEGVTSPQLGLLIIPVIALGFVSVWCLAQLPSDVQGWMVFAMSAVFPLIFIPLSRLAPKLRVTNLVLRVGREVISRFELARVEIADGPTNLSFVTLVDIHGVRRGAVTLKGLPEEFVTALAQAHIEVERKRLTRR